MEKLGPGDPQRIGAYRLMARLGAGGMGHVYLARSDRGRTVAVKLVREELAAQEEFRARFRQEVQAATRVGGHWTAPVLDADTEADIPWVATGYVAGPSLQEVVGHDHGALPERSVRILAAGLAHALQDIHTAGLIHRDLKPSNVLVTIDGPRVIDFGIARALETVTDGGLTRTGALVGSPGFMAPEQVRGDRITPACDVFCLGSVLSYAATGALPFGAANSGVHALMFRIAQEEPDLTGLPEGLTDLVRECLRKDPAARPTLDDILERTGAEDTVSDGRARDPWLPSALVAQLGRHAVQLLDTENPDEPSAALPALPPGPPPSTPDLSKQPSAPVPAPSPQADDASPEHSAAPSEDGSAPPVPGQPNSLDHLPTMVAGAGRTPPPNSPPALPPAAGPGAVHPAYGYPQQHPQQYPGQHPQPPAGPAAYGYPQGAYGPALGPTPPYGPGPTPPYGPGVVPPGQYPGQQEPPRRNSRSTVVLIVVALVVALGAGGSVYALMGRGGDKDKANSTSPSPTAPTTPGQTTPAPTSPTPTTEPPTSQTPQDGAIPTGYLGTWEGTIDNDTGHSTRQLVIQQGDVGDTVVSVTADGPTKEGGTYHCVFQAELAQKPTGNGPLEIGPSTITVGGEGCTPGKASEITLLPDGTLHRTTKNSVESLTYTRTSTDPQ
ncbi:serine/threonine-protein kinase [Streptomyces sp. R21]|uniref:Serine/threonine-protein kinase n=1 Tax=Streptomyces sp. R21 TaxID=3238627 RepID=A0AB39PDH9_9ACTN